MQTFVKKIKIKMNANNISGPIKDAKSLTKKKMQKVS
jgi:hypothetical protein